MAGSQAGLRRVLGLPALIFFGVGTMVGGGFYALLGEVVGKAGLLAPLAFLAAGLLALVNAGTFAELSSRFPVSAGEARYVEEGLETRWLSGLTGWLVIATGVVSTATLSVATAGFLRDLLPMLPQLPSIIGLVLVLGLLAAWGVGQSVATVALITVIEVATLIVIIVLRGALLGELPARYAEAPAVDAWPAASMVFSGAFLAFYAFIGFEDLVNMAEEARRPRKTMPRALLVSVVLTTLLYLVGVLVAVAAVPTERLAAAKTPVAELLPTESHAGRVAVGLVSLLTGLNGALVQVLMASRVAYGLAHRGLAPRWLGHVAARTSTPVRGTAAVIVVVLVLALGTPLGTLAESTSAIILVVFALVNVALIVLPPGPAREGFRAPRWVPWVAGLGCVGALLAKLVGWISGA